MNPLGSFSKAPATIKPSRELLTSDRTYYVSPTIGSDSNTGLTVASPFLTIQKAVDVVCTKIDMAEYQVTIQLADGTYTSGAELKPYVGTKAPIIQGNSSTPNNVLINTSTSCISHLSVSEWNIKYLKVQTSSGYGILLSGTGAKINIISVNYGGVTICHIGCYWGAEITVSGNYIISGGGSNHLCAHSAILTSTDTATITISGTPTFSTAFAQGIQLGHIRFSGKTFSGSATGKRYIVDCNGFINTNLAGASYFPGSIAGTAVDGGLYK